MLATRRYIGKIPTELCVREKIGEESVLRRF
jgi:hypothetical protein